MKKLIALLLALVMVIGLVACSNNNKPAGTTAPAGTEPAGTEPAGTEPAGEAENPLAGTYDVTLWVSEIAGMTELTQQMIDAFEVAYPGIVINAQIEGVAEGDAGSKAVREVCPDALVAVHFANPEKAGSYDSYAKNLDYYQVDYDVFASSYYPYWHGTPEELFANLNACRRFGKEIMIMELGYGFTTKAYNLDGKERRLVIDSERAFVPGVTEKYPMTPEGQANFIRHILALSRENDIAGVFYWEPLWLPGEGICWASEAGQAYIHEEGKSTSNEWANQCLFDYEGRKLPAFDVFV